MKYTTFSFSPDYFKSKIIEAGPKWMIRAAVLLSIALLWLFIFSLISPAAGEAWLFNSFVISGVLTAGFVGIVNLLILGVGVLFASACISLGYRIARNEIAASNGEVRQLSGGGQYYVGPDIVVVQGEGESDNVFNARVSDFIDEQKPGQWIVALPFQSAYIKIKDESAKGRSVRRGGYAGDTAESDGILPDYNPMGFSLETRSDYNTYINEFLPRFKTYAEWYRAEKTKQPPFMKPGTITTIFLFLFLSLSATAQTNTDKVKTAVSANDFAPTAGQQVHYVFSDGSSATRTADGQKKISELFSAGYIGADNIQRGEVVGIDVDRRPVDIKVKIAATGTESKPAPLFQSRMEPHNEAVPQKSFTESLPDSATVANTLNEAKQQLPVYKQVIYKMFKPVWEFAAWLFFFLCPLFGIALGFCNLVSRSARQNGNLGPAVADQQIRFAAAAWWISICVVGSAYICITASMFFWEWNPYVITALCILGYIPAKWAINRLTPNGEYQETITTTRQSGRIGGGNSQRFLNQ